MQGLVDLEVEVAVVGLEVGVVGSEVVVALEVVVAEDLEEWVVWEVEVEVAIMMKDKTSDLHGNSERIFSKSILKNADKSKSLVTGVREYYFLSEQ